MIGRKPRALEFGFIRLAPFVFSPVDFGAPPAAVLQQTPFEHFANLALVAMGGHAMFSRVSESGIAK
jgi:hypothetical protein